MTTMMNTRYVTPDAGLSNFFTNDALLIHLSSYHLLASTTSDILHRPKTIHQQWRHHIKHPLLNIPSQIPNLCLTFPSPAPFVIHSLSKLHASYRSDRRLLCTLPRLPGTDNCNYPQDPVALAHRMLDYAIVLQLPVSPQRHLTNPPSQHLAIALSTQTSIVRFRASRNLTNANLMPLAGSQLQQFQLVPNPQR